MQDEKKPLDSKCVVLGVCSSIAAYKATEIVSALAKLGADVVVIMTQNATKLVSPRVFQTISHNPVYSDMWENVSDWHPEHVSVAQRADIFLVAPATANTIGNMANGLAPDMITSTYLATKAKVLIAPAMNTAMYEHPAVVQNMKILSQRGAEFIDAESGQLACGDVGKGRLACTEAIISAVLKAI